MYKFARNCLFMLDAERSHQMALQGLQWAHRLKLLSLMPKIASNSQEIMGMIFSHPVGLAAGLDKNGEYIEPLAALGFSFIEIGTVTPKPQPGNARPRIFRLIDHRAIINRLGFNNKGVEYVVQQLKKTRYRGILGINIGKNKDTPLEHAVYDYLYCFHHLAPFASYIVINVSSPNTYGLRNLQRGHLFNDLLASLKEAQKNLAQSNKRYIPLVVKISPDISDGELSELAATLINHRIDGVIAANTTLHRDETAHPNMLEIGGLSGQPLKKRNTFIIQQLYSLLKHQIPIIASGGIMDKASAQEKLQAGASLLQLYTGFIYEGPQLVRQLAKL